MTVSNARAYTLWLAIAVVLLTHCGCGLPTGILRSRWAMDDPEYAEKYAEGASKTDLLGKLKQASDARFMDQATGTYVSTGVTHRPDNDAGLFTAEVGGESYVASYLTTRGSASAMINSDDWFFGTDVGIRLQTPTRIAPFVGIGAMVGFANETIDADDDWEDNDEDGLIDEWGEQETRLSGAFAGVYPEFGGHLWWNSAIRISGYGRYVVTTEGRNADDWMIGVSIACFENPLF